VESIGSFWHWLGFVLLVLFMLALDLGVFHRRPRAVNVKQALGWSLVWVGLSAAFGVFVYVAFGEQRALEFATGYLLEKALSVDNLFVFVMLFGAFRVPQASQHRVLFWGVLGALVMRALFIVTGSALLVRFHWLMYLFGAGLLFTAIKLWLGRADEASQSPLEGKAYKLLRRLLPCSNELEGERFFTRKNRRLLVTPLFVVLLLIEASDLIFAVDSLPAVLSVTRDPFIVFTSNVLAILGLRSLYFVLESFVQRFHYLKAALSLVLGFVGVKMLTEGVYAMPIAVSLAFICATLIGAVVLSLRREKRLRAERQAAPAAGSSDNSSSTSSMLKGFSN
jgi:tellurite resistance protein TerC